MMITTGMGQYSTIPMDPLVGVLDRIWSWWEAPSPPMPVPPPLPAGALVKGDPGGVVDPGAVDVLIEESWEAQQEQMQDFFGELAKKKEPIPWAWIGVASLAGLLLITTVRR